MSPLQRVIDEAVRSRNLFTEKVYAEQAEIDALAIALVDIGCDVVLEDYHLRVVSYPSVVQVNDGNTCPCFPGTCRGEVRDGKNALGQRCKATMPAR